MLDKSRLTFVEKDNTNTAEIARFDKLAASWWDPNGQYQQVLAFNACRWKLIEQQITHYFSGCDLSK